MAPRRRTPKVGLRRIDAALDALRPMGFPDDVVRKTIRSLLKAYGGDDGWKFIEEYSYQLVIDAILEEQANTEQEKLEEDCSQQVNGEGTSDSKRPAAETSSWTLEPSCSSVNPNTALQISNGLDCASVANEALCTAKLTNESVEAECNLTRHVRYPWSSSHSTPLSHNPPLPDSNSTRKRRPCYGWICSDDEEDLVELRPGPLAEEIENWLSSFREHRKRWDEDDNVEVTSGSPLPAVKSQKLEESIRIPKKTIDILKDQVFAFDTFFVTNQEPYEGGVLFKGNLRGQAARSYEKISTRMQNKFGDQYRLFFLINPEYDKPVAVIIPKTTLQPETTAVPESFAAGAVGLVTVLTLLLRNVPVLQSNLFSTFDNLNLLLDGLAGAFVTALLLGVHELGHILVAKSTGVKLGVPFFVPSWQIGSFGAITRIKSIVPNREDLLKVAAAGPLAGFSLGFVLFLLDFILPPSDGIGVVDASVFHESFLAGGVAKLLIGDVLKEGELDGRRISFAIWGRKASARFTALSIGLLGLSSLFNDVAFYLVVLLFFLQRGPIAPLSDEITDPDDKYVAHGVLVLILGLLVCLPYPFPFIYDSINTDF
ncbi:hypothetical protein CRYUN_Cryun41cG0008200 [Craigia yunnanensis]